MQYLNIIAKQGKPLCDGEYIKEPALFLFEDFENKDKIIQRIKDFPITRDAVNDQVL